MAHPLCRRAINSRVTGDPNEWPLDWFRRTRANASFDRGVSWGCGTGAFERSAILSGLVRAIDAFDLSEASLAEARAESAREGLTGLEFRYGTSTIHALRRADTTSRSFTHRCTM
jgi:predicted TPR repeat methyltransferase